MGMWEENDGHDPATPRNGMRRFPWWLILLIILFPTPFGPWWVTIICLAGFLLMLALLMPERK